MEEMILKVGYTDDNLCISIPREIVEDESRVEVSVTPMPGALEVNMLLTDPVYDEDEDEYDPDEDDGCGYPYHGGFLKI